DIFSGDVICGIGHTTSFFPEKLLNNRDFDVDGIRCYWLNGEQLLQFGDIDCDEIYNNYNDVAENDETGFKVYPNPTNGVITIEIGDNETFQKTSLQATEYTITNICGQIVMKGTISSETRQIDISNLENGMYFINVGDKSLKFVKK
ncbi:MAG: T9SS type A sorting domain-containing protein, partial [Bacteroidales bacterium]|nr:T9SS type A sorting domain-containing protein [Bacteroidales bacterium]